MFKDKFKEELNTVNPTKELEAAVLNRIKKEKELLIPTGTKKTVQKRLISAVAAAVAVVIFAAVVLKLPIFSNNSDYINHPGSYPEETASNAESSETASNNDASSNVTSATTSKPTSSNTGEVIKFPTIKYKNNTPTNITHKQVYELFSAIYKTYNYDKPTSGVSSKTSYKNSETENFHNSYSDGGSYDYVSDSPSQKEDFSKTNTQVENVDEADVVKTDGEFIYILNPKKFAVSITGAQQGALTAITTINVAENLSKDVRKSLNLVDMYLSEKRVTVIFNSVLNSKAVTGVIIFDISDRYKPKKVCEILQSGSYISSRLISDNLYIFTNENFYNEPKKSDLFSYLPYTVVKGKKSVISEGNISIFCGEVKRSFFTAGSINITSGKMVDAKTVLGGGSEIYANEKSIYVTASSGFASYLNENSDIVKKYINTTRIVKFTINAGKISAKAEGYVNGTISNQFAMDEYNGYFRVVVSGWEGQNTGYLVRKSSAVYVLDSNLKILGSITGIARGETLKSVRFMGDIGYFVTYRQVDPLFAVDFKNPKNPKILSKLKIPGFSNYLHPFAEDLLLGLGQESSAIKISMFNVKDPTNVTELHSSRIRQSETKLGNNHKAILISYDKNIIGFPTVDGYYYIYSYDRKEGFEEKNFFKIPTNSNDTEKYIYNRTRGIYIGDYFYICNYAGIDSYSLLTYDIVDSLSF